MLTFQPFYKRGYKTGKTEPAVVVVAIVVEVVSSYFVVGYSLAAIVAGIAVLSPMSVVS